MDCHVPTVRGSRWVLSGWLLLVASITSLANAQETKTDATATTPAESAEVKAIRAAGAAYATALNEGDATALAASWTADGDYVDASGQHFKARDLIAEDFGGLTKNELPHHLEIKESKIRLITPDVAIEDGLSQTTAGDTGAVALGRFTAVWIKRDDKWLLDVVRECGGLPLTDDQQLEPLTWMIGDWIGESGGLTYSLSVRW
ncbi:MAG: SgcJ/EcaC family oxidoreductase, partial [Pirellulales bacterium]